MGTFPSSILIIIIIIIIVIIIIIIMSAVLLITPPRIFVAEAVRQMPGFDPRPVRVRFVALGQVACRLLQFTPVSIIPCSPYSASGLINSVWCGQFQQILVCVKVNTQSEE
jgi:hypothetical protein